MSPPPPAVADTGDLDLLFSPDQSHPRLVLTFLSKTTFQVSLARQVFPTCVHCFLLYSFYFLSLPYLCLSHWLSPAYFLKGRAEVTNLRSLIFFPLEVSGAKHVPFGTALALLHTAIILFSCPSTQTLVYLRLFKRF